jgi:hypothetical protein
MNLSDLVRAAMSGDDLAARQWVKDARRLRVDIPNLPMPTDLNESELSTCAALVDLFSLRGGTPAPPWLAQVAPSKQPVYLDSDALRRPKLRRLLEEDSPEPLRRRNVFAAAQYLDIRF